MNQSDQLNSASADLRLRAPPGPVLRLSRRAVAVLAGAGGVVLIGAVGFGMSYKPKSRERAPELMVGGAPPESVRQLPADYHHPKLGAPLPGDLGRPMLAASAVNPAAGEGSAQVTASPAAARDASRVSPLFLARVRTAPALQPPAATWSSASAAAADEVAPGSARARLMEPVSPHVVQAGAVIPAALMTGLRSDLSGQVIAQVTQPVFDSQTGKTLLIPQGARLVGSYESRLTFAQRRVMVTWSRLMLPNGKSLRLDAIPAGDASGQMGLEDHVDHRWPTLLATAGLSTLLSIGAELGADDDDDLVRAIRRGAIDTFNQAGQQAVDKGLSAAPILTIRPGAQVRAIVTSDLILEPYVELTQ